MRTTLATQPGSTGLACPYCGRYATKETVTSALRQLTSHAAKLHRSEYAVERWCNGPAHREGPVLLPIGGFNRRGRAYDGRRWCKRCESLGRGVNSGWVPVAAVRPYVLWLHERYGSGEHPAIPVSTGCFYNILARRTQFVRKSVAARLMLAAPAARTREIGVDQATASSDCAAPNCPLEASDGTWCGFHSRLPEASSSFVYSAPRKHKRPPSPQ